MDVLQVKRESSSLSLFDVLGVKKKKKKKWGWADDLDVFGLLYDVNSGMGMMHCTPGRETETSCCMGGKYGIWFYSWIAKREHARFKSYLYIDFSINAEPLVWLHSGVAGGLGRLRVWDVAPPSPLTVDAGLTLTLGLPWRTCCFRFLNWIFQIGEKFCEVLIPARPA